MNKKCSWEGLPVIWGAIRILLYVEWFHEIYELLHPSLGGQEV